MSELKRGDFPAEIYDLIQTDGFETVRTRGMIAPETNLYDYTQGKWALDLNVRPPLDCQKAVWDRLLIPIERFFTERLGTKQIFYSREWLHSTFFQFITCEAEPNFEPDKENVEPFKQISRVVLADLAPIEVSYNRFIWSSSGFPGLLLGGVPVDNRVNQMRDRVELLATEQGLRLSRPRTSRIFHMVLMRNLTPVGVERSNDIIDFIQQRDKSEIWAGELDHVNLVLGDYLMRPELTQILDTYQLHK